MQSNPLTRIILLIRFRWRVILFGAALLSFITSTLSIFSPYIYTSQALVDVTPESDTDEFAQDMALLGRAGGRKESSLSSTSEREFSKAVSLAQSRMLLGLVAEEMLKTSFDTTLAFPKISSVADIRRRLKIASRHLGTGTRTIDRFTKDADSRNSSPPYLIEGLRRHLSIGSDRTTGAIRFEYSSADPHTAVQICEVVVEKYVKILEKRTSERYQKIASYIDSRMATQLKFIEQKETKIQEIYLKYPELAQSGKRGQSVSPFTNSYVQKKSKLEKMKVELESANTILNKLRQALASESSLPKQITTNLRNQVVSEIAAQEYRKMQLEVIRKLASDSPQLKTVNKRLATLRELLKAVEFRTTKRKMDSIGAMGSYEEIAHKMDKLLRKRIDMKTKIDAMETELNEAKAKMRDGLGLQYRLNNLLRQVAAASDNLKFLSIKKQEKSYEGEGTSNVGTVLLKPTKPIFSKNLSIKKRMFFSFFVGIALTLFIITALDLLSPFVLSPDDISAYNLSLVANMNLSKKTVSQTVVQIRALDGGRLEKSKAPVVLFTSTSVDFNYNRWLSDITEVFAERGERVAFVRIGVPGIQNYAMDHPNVKTILIPPKNVAFSLEEKIDEIHGNFDRVFVLYPKMHQHPINVVLRRIADYVFVVSKIGVTTVDEIRAIKKMSLSRYGVPYYVMLFDG